MPRIHAYTQQYLSRSPRETCVNVDSNELTVSGIDVIGLSSVNRILSVRIRGIILLILIINLIIIG